MYERILIATDGSDRGRRAVEEGVRLAKTLGALVVAVTVTEPREAVMAGGEVFAPSPRDYSAEAAASADKLLASVAEAAAKAEVSCRVVHLRDRLVPEGIVEVAQRDGCDLIVMAAHRRRGIARIFLPSVSARVLALSNAPVLILR
jgi:nucleotide-binding universal stress UspA family protein